MIDLNVKLLNFYFKNRKIFDLWELESENVKLLSHVWLCAAPWTVACQVPLSMGFPGKNTGVGCHFLLQEIFLTRDKTQASCITDWIFLLSEPPEWALLLLSRFSRVRLCATP